MADPTILKDPTDPYGLNAAKRQRQMADALRKQGEAPVGGGEMVSGHYVAPAWTQQLAKLAGTVGGAYMGGKADASEEASKAAISEATNQWTQGIPQAVAAQTLPGETKEGLYGPETFAPKELTPEIPVTGPQVLKHALAGRAIPGNEENAKLYQTGAMADLAREDNQREALRKQTLDQQLKRETTDKELQAKKEALEKELAGKAATDASRAETAKMIDATNRLIAANREEGAMARAQLRAESAGNKPVNPTVVDKLNKGYEKLSTFQQLAGEYQPEYSGVKGAAADWAGKLPLVNTKSNEWWKNYKRESALIERHGLFGSALTPAELASWKEADISSDMDSTKVADNLARRQKIMRDHFQAQERAYEKGGHKVTGMFDIGPEPAPVAGSTAAAAATAPAAAPVKVATPADAMKLPPGTVFIDPNGVTRTR